jgi:hypothetical protein
MDTHPYAAPLVSVSFGVDAKLCVSFRVWLCAVLACHWGPRLLLPHIRAVHPPSRQINQAYTRTAAAVPQ